MGMMGGIGSAWTSCRPTTRCGPSPRRPAARPTSRASRANTAQIFGAIHEALRNQYVLTYMPTNKAHDGTYRKIKVELVNPATNEPLAVKDEKGKPVKYSIVAKSGYKAHARRRVKSRTRSRDFPRR